MMGCSGCNDTGGASYNESLRKPVRAGIPSARLTPDFVGPFWTLSITDAPHHPPPGRRSSHPIRARTRRIPSPP